MDLPEDSTSLWTDPEAPSYPVLEGDHEADVVVVGGGIAGLTTALLVAESGRSVMVLEGLRVAGGTSGRTTAKVAALQGQRYQHITEHHGADAARRYARSQLDALDWLARKVAASDIDCDWERRASITFAETEQGRQTVEAELAAASAAGLAVETVAADLPYPTTAAIALAGQAQFHPGRYLAALAAEVDASPNAQLFEHSRVVSIRGHRQQEVRTALAVVRAQTVVVTTLLPIVDRGLFFARGEPTSSYLVALRTDGDLPEGMYLSADSRTRSLRTAPSPDGPLLLVGGEGHPTGQGSPTLPRYQELADWAADRFAVTSVAARWSAHDISPTDQLPWVGASSPLSPNVLAASGFDKWGMTMGTAAALALADRITGESDGISATWAGLFDPARMSARGIGSTAKLNAKVAERLVADWLRPKAPADAAGRGARRRDGLVPVGEPDATGGSEVTVVCTHLGGICSWNDGDATWDCPLHGSRFAPDGSVIAGPATAPLRIRSQRSPQEPSLRPDAS